MNKDSLKWVGLAGLTSLTVALFFYGSRERRKKRYLAISLGGTHAKLCVLQRNEHIDSFTLVSSIFDVETRTPTEFLAFVRETFKPDDFDHVAIASFGPLWLRRDERYGQLIVAPCEQKQAWEKYSLALALKAAFGKPAHVETDVNAAAVAEFRLGNHGDIRSLAYVTIGTGVGVGLVINGKTVHGYLHPEGGHTVWAHKRQPAGGRPRPRLGLSPPQVLRRGELTRAAATSTTPPASSAATTPNSPSTPATPSGSASASTSRSSA